MKTITTIIVTLLATASAFATPVKLTFDQAAGVVAGLHALDGYTVLDADKKQAHVSYDFKGDVRRAIRHDLIVVQKAVDDMRAELTQTFADLRKADCSPELIALSDKNSTLPADKQIQLTPEQAKQVEKLNADWKTANAVTQTVDVTIITEADLNEDANPIPGSATQALAPISIDPSTTTPKPK